MKVFISSTVKDLQPYRQKAIEVLNRYEWIPLAMEFFGAQPQEPTTICADKIHDCDIFIGIYAHRYGFIPNGQEKSITQLEYELAKELGKDRLCFIVEKSFPWNPDFIEWDKNAALNAFLNTVKKECVVEFFKSPEDFTGELATSLANLVAKRRGTGVGKEEFCLVPFAPFPYMAHPYALPEHFTGRRSEMAGLSNWFFNETEPVLLLEAIGGMGKSALSWAWLRQDIIERAVKVDGVFWWSFYINPFESFISHLACYVTGKRGKDTGPALDLEELSAVLHQRRFLLVLDGLERILRGYAGMEAMYIQEKRYAGDKGATAESGDQWDIRMREPVHPRVGRFLRALAAGNTKTLITTRLKPASLEGIAGVKPVFLKGLAEDDTVSFFRGEGINGTRAEMVQAGRVYDFHPLMLKLLASTLKRSRARDIQAAFSQNLVNLKEPHKILMTSYKLLSEDERRVVIRAAVFRGVFSFDAIKALVQEVEENRLWEVLQELRGLGFLLGDETPDRFDLHPILRSFLYEQLTSAGETGVHDLAVHYFRALPAPEKVVTLEDLAPVIELYHHLVKAGKYEEAWVLFRDRIHNPIYYQLSSYPLLIELMRELFPEGKDRLPRLNAEADQAWLLTALANTYGLSGQPAQAEPLFLQSIKLTAKNAEKTNLAIDLGNVAAMAQISLGRLSAAAAHVQKSISLCRESGEERQKAVGHQQWGRVLAFQGRVSGNTPGPCVEAELNLAFQLFEKNKQIQSLSIVSADRSLSALLQASLVVVRPMEEPEEPRAAALNFDAVEQAYQALAFAENTIKTRYPHPRDFIRVYWLLGEALVQGVVTPEVTRGSGLEISFYDEYFQQRVDTLAVQPGLELHAAERCLQEALRRCRKINMVDLEPDLLLALVRMEWAGVHGQPIQEKIKRLPSLEEPLLEAHDLAKRCGYRLKLADLHLFCGKSLLECRSTGKETHTLLGLTAGQHLQKTKDYALDVSEFTDLYQSPDPGFYKGIPEYEMLKRGLTPEEQIRNGYFPAYTMAVCLEAGL